MSTDLFTCVTCNIAFNNPDLQRAHYKTDWHRYNLKRKVADMPAINLQDFQERVQLQKIQVKILKF
jgi:pre-60S factor REI1